MSTQPTEKDTCKEDVYKQLFMQWAESLFRFLYIKYKNEALARDAMQEAFITLWNNCKKVSPAKAKNYVFTVGRNRCIDELRQKNKHLTIPDDNNSYHQLVDENLEEERDDTKQQKIQFILSKMPSPSKEAFLMNRIQGLTYAEIAEDLDISVKAVEKRMMIALRTIKEELLKNK